MKSYKAEELFDKNGRLLPELAELAPVGDRRMGANPHANGGILLRDLRMPDFHVHAVKVPSPGAVKGQDTLVLGKFPSGRGEAEPGPGKISVFSAPMRRFPTCWERFLRRQTGNGRPGK